MANNLTELLREHRPFHPVVPFNPAKDTLTALDFTAANATLTREILSDTEAFSAYVDDQLQQSGGRYGIGGYAEHRTIYSRSELFDAVHAPVPERKAVPVGYSDQYTGAETMIQEETTGIDSLPFPEREKPRRLHLGIDIWGALHTHVMAPLDGIVHSFGFHHQLGNYGAVIILVHCIEGHSFYTLYGHLSYGSIVNLREGQRIERGDVFAEFGMPRDNGSWPPHLHFQVMQSMQGWQGDYPGVCAYSEKDKWLENCVDPDLILDMMQYAK
jgi:peptidoglycan LD-endopeptidase LytH